MINSIFLLISILLSVAFVTLLERKLLSYVQTRKGPNLVGLLGILQPFSDGMKLLTKKEPHWGNSNLILISPLLFWSIALIFWMVISASSLLMNMSFLWLLVFSSFGGLLTFLTGWNGGSSYSIMGGLRSSAQMISYEVVLSFFFLISMNMSMSLNFFSLKESNLFSSLMSGWFLILPLWLVSSLAETNRAPFDLTEGESELVSGFNTEYSSISFTLLFLGEYTMILGFSMLSSFLFCQTWFWGFFFSIFYLWIRSCFPRKRYDHLMNLMWMFYFPIILIFLFIEIMIFIL